MSFPIQTILNNPSMRPNTPISNLSGSEASSPASEITDAFPPPRSFASGNKRTRDAGDLSFIRPIGTIRYGAYENKDDEVSMELMRPFDIFPFGEIQDCCAQIPYSSDKKDLKTKTGREKLEVFVYRFTDPNDKQSYDVMWDFRGGYVRISPFFKNRKHKKTGPAKMLDANPGMRDVTTQITGGNRNAQGYWVHMLCARAVCATFCYHIRGALIPIFGPDFPTDCIRPDQPGFNCMAIDPNIIREADTEAKAYRITGRPLAAITSHPQRLAKDQYAGSPMNQCGQNRHAERHYLDASFGISPPQHYAPPPVDHSQVTRYADSEREYYREPLNPFSAHRPSTSRPESSDSDWYEPWPSLSAVSYRGGAPLPPPAQYPTQRYPEPEQPFDRIEKRRLSRDEDEAKRQKGGIESQYAGWHANPRLAYENSPAPPAPIDPELDRVSDQLVESTTSSKTSRSPATQAPKHTPEEYEAAAILLAMSLTGTIIH